MPDPRTPAAVDDARTTGRSSTASTAWTVWWLGAGIIAIAFNLRPAVASLGAVLDEVSRQFALSPTLAGLLTTLPVLCFAGLGPVAAPLARRFGIRTALAATMGAATLGLAVRAFTHDTTLFIAGTIMVLGGLAIGNVLLPACVKAYFPHHVGVLTAAYTTALAIGTTAGSALTVPIADAGGGLSYGLGIWALTAAVAALPWVMTLRRDEKGVRGRRGTPRPSLVRSPLAWSLALFFGLQSGQAYVIFGWLPQIFKDAGLSATTAGLLLSIQPIATIPMSLAIPAIASRLPNPRVLVVACGVFYVAGYAGLGLAPATVPWLWVVLIGVGGGAFPLALTLIGMRARTGAATAQLSGFVQSAGYLLGAAGPFGIGMLYDWTDGWTVPLVLLTILIVPQVVAGVRASRPRYVEDEV